MSDSPRPRCRRESSARLARRVAAGDQDSGRHGRQHGDKPKLKDLGIAVAGSRAAIAVVTRTPSSGGQRRHRPDQPKHQSRLGQQHGDEHGRTKSHRAAASAGCAAVPDPAPRRRKNKSRQRHCDAGARVGKRGKQPRQRSPRKPVKVRFQMPSAKPKIAKCQIGQLAAMEGEQRRARPANSRNSSDTSPCAPLPRTRSGPRLPPRPVAAGSAHRTAARATSGAAPGSLPT